MLNKKRKGDIRICGEALFSICKKEKETPAFAVSIHMGAKRIIKKVLSKGQVYRRLLLKKAGAADLKAVRNEEAWQPVINGFLNEYEHSELDDHAILYEAFAGRGLVCGPSGIFHSFLRRPDFSEYKHIIAVENEELVSKLTEELKSELTLRSDSEPALESESRLALKSYSKPDIEFHSQHSSADSAGLPSSGISFVIRNSDAYIHALATCKYLINNLSFPNYFIKRPGQIYINTWHGIPLKTLGFDIPEGRISGSNTVRNFLMTDVFTSPNSFMSDIFKKAFRLEGISSGDIMESGMPRIDNIFHAYRKAIYKSLTERGVDFDPDKKLILYAPTWRGSSYNTPDIGTETYISLMDEVQKHIDTDRYQILTKPHQIVWKYMMESEKKLDGRFIPADFDACDILAITDVLVSDYSSIYFDFLVKEKPIFFYIPDLKSYENSRGLYFGTDKLPGPIATTLDTLGSYFDDIEKTFEPYKSAVHKEKLWACPHDDGEAADRVIENIIVSKTGQPDHSPVTGNKTTQPDHSPVTGNKTTQPDLHPITDQKTRIPSVLIYSDLSFDREINDRINALLKAMDTGKYDVTLAVSKEATDEVLAWIKSISKEIRVLRLFNDELVSTEESGLLHILKTMTYEEILNEPAERLNALKSLAVREMRRCFGDAHFDMSSVIFEFDNYMSNIFKLYSYQYDKKNFYVDRPESFISPDRLHLQASILSLKKHGSKCIIRARLIRSPLITGIDRVVLRYRGENEADKEMKYKLTDSDLKNSDLNNSDLNNSGSLTGRSYYPLKEKHGSRSIIIETEVDFRGQDLRELYWDIFIIANDDIPPVAFKFTSNHFKYRFYINNMEFKVNSDHTAIPYYTGSGTLAFLYRESSEYDGMSTKFKDALAFVRFTLTKRYLRKKNIWLVYEKFCKMAQDNGYYFFKYCMEKLPPEEKKHIFYVIDKRSDDYKNVKKYEPQVLQFMSVRHMTYALAARVYVGSDAMSHLYAWRSKSSLVRSRMTRVPVFFLQHGVTALKNVSKFFSATGTSRMTHFAVTSYFEQEIAEKYLFYSKENAPVTGFTRWDVLEDRSDPSDRLVLIMPTWRAWLEEVTEEEFMASDYYKNYSSLLKSGSLKRMLKKYNAHAVFYIHPKFAQYIDTFIHEADTDAVISIVRFGEKPLNEIMMRCRLLITDYSSVCWDVYYQAKPVIFYQFDYDHYMRAHGSFIDMKNELFGRRTESLDEMLKLLEDSLKDDFKLPERDRLKLDYYFPYRDDKNSERTYLYLKKKYR